MELNEIVNCRIAAVEDKCLIVQICNKSYERGIIYRRDTRYVSVGEYEDVFQPGDIITASVVKLIKPGLSRLSVRAAIEHPYDILKSVYSTGDVFENAKVIRTSNKYGITVVVEESLQLRIDKEDLPKEPEEYQIGEEVGDVQLTTFNDERKSAKAILSGE